MKRSPVGRDLNSTGVHSKPNDAWVGGEKRKEHKKKPVSDLNSLTTRSRWDKDRATILPDCHLNDDTAQP